jgi:hypothetical protein
MRKFDKDIGWTETLAMSPCVCEHLEKSHRPLSRKCSLCDCQQFTPVQTAEKSTHN